MPNDITFARAFKTADDPGFADHWYIPTQQGDQLNALQAYLSVARRDVDLLANAVQQIPKRIMRGTIDRTKTLAPFNWGDLQNVLATDAIVSGEWYCRRKDIGGEIVLERLLPSTIKYYYSQGKLTHFTRQTAIGPETYYPDDPNFIYWWEQNFLTEQGPGASILASALLDADLINSGLRFAWAANIRGGPLTLLMTKKMSKEDSEKTEHWWRKATRGFNNFFRGLVVQADVVEPKQFGGNPRDMEIDKGITAASQRLTSNLGVPASLRYANAANYATAMLDKCTLIDGAAMPLAERIFDPLDVKVFGLNGAKLEYHPEEMPCFAYFMTERADSLIALRDADFVTTSHAQNVLGLPITPIRVMSNQTPAPVQGATTATPQRVTPFVPQSQAADMQKAQWMRKALNALERGKPASVTFTSDAIGAIEHAQITQALTECKTADDVKRVFAVPSEGAMILAELKRANDLAERLTA